MTELKKQHYDLIMDCLDEFDFNKVNKVMHYLGWKYSDSNDVPTVQELRKNARKYLQMVAEEALSTNKEYTVATGGFRYEAKVYENENNVLSEENFLWLRMSFSIEEWDNC